MKNWVLLTFLIVLINIVNGTVLPATIVVAQDGSGDFTTITAAIKSLPMYCYQRVNINVKKGIYIEKIKIDRDYITLNGESRDSTFIHYSQLRSNWDKNPDNIGPAVVNIFADDIIIKNLTIENTQSEIGPHAFAIYGTGTRTILKNCSVLSKGGDTVSLWNYKTGMYYHDSCYFQGAVDFVCPRGWCYISNSTFFELKNTAAVWHAAPTNLDQKFVLKNCDFQGADSFYLARHHYDAQFFFVNCTFPKVMLNKPIQHVYYPDNPEKNRPYLYGDRYYFYNCQRSSGNYNWFADNMTLWPKNTPTENITAQWTFDNEWNPENTAALQVNKYELTGYTLRLHFNELVGINGIPILVSNSGIEFKYHQGSGRDILEFRAVNALIKLNNDDTLRINEGQIHAIHAHCNSIIFNHFSIKKPH